MSCRNSTCSSRRVDDNHRPHGLRLLLRRGHDELEETGAPIAERNKEFVKEGLASVHRSCASLPRPRSARTLRHSRPPSLPTNIATRPAVPESSAPRALLAAICLPVRPATRLAGCSTRRMYEYPQPALWTHQGRWVASHATAGCFTALGNATIPQWTVSRVPSPSLYRSIGYSQATSPVRSRDVFTRSS